MCDTVEPSDGVNLRQGIRGGQLSRRHGCEGYGAMIALQGVEFARSALRVSERGGDIG